MRFFTAKIVPLYPYTLLDTFENSRGFNPFRAFRRLFGSLRWESKPPRYSHPYQFLLKIFQIFGRKNCKEMIFALENEIFHRKKSFCPIAYAAVYV